MTTASRNNSFVQNGMLYIVPTLTSDNIGTAAVFDGTLSPGERLRDVDLHVHHHDGEHGHRDIQ